MKFKHLLTWIVMGKSPSQQEALERAKEIARRDMMENVELRKNFLRMQEAVNALKIVSPDHPDISRLEKELEAHYDELRHYGINPKEFICLK